MEIALQNLSQAVQSADEHRDYAIVAGLMGNKKFARKHECHAKAIMDEVMRLTASECDLSTDELLAALLD